MSDTRQRLTDWMRHEGLSKAELARRMNYGSYAHVHAILASEKDLPPAFVGRFLLCFGPIAAAAVFSNGQECLGQSA